MKRIVSALIAVATLSGAAQAADLIVAPQIAPAASSAYDWSGFYAGVFAGYGTGTATALGSVNGLTDTIGLGGALLGVDVGVNAQFDQFVLGLEGDIAWANINGAVACVGAPALSCGGTINWLSTVRGRVGYAVDQALLYATAGVAIGGVTASVTPPVALTTGTFTDTYVGFTVGAGAEVALTDDITLKAEYGYADLGTRVSPVGTLGAVNAYTIHPTVHTVKLGANFQF